MRRCFVTCVFGLFGTLYFVLRTCWCHLWSVTEQTRRQYVQTICILSLTLTFACLLFQLNGWLIFSERCNALWCRNTACVMWPVLWSHQWNGPTDESSVQKMAKSLSDGAGQICWEWPSVCRMCCFCWCFPFDLKTCAHSNECSFAVLFTVLKVAIRDFKIQRRGWQRERQKNNRFYKQNNNFARALRFFVHFFARFCTTTTWKCLISRFIEYVNKQRRNFISLSELGYGP